MKHVQYSLFFCPAGRKYIAITHQVILCTSYSDEHSTAGLATLLNTTSEGVIDD